MKKTVSAFIVFYVLWLAIAGLSIQEWITGGIVSLVLALVLRSIVNYEFELGTIITVVKFTVLYLPLFIWKLLIANLQMAKIVLSPKLPINPGFVVVKTGLKKDISKLSLANSITLTPGTLSIEVADDEVLVHWVDVQGKDQADYRDQISISFEKTLGGIFE
ncbi:MAG: Na+/H+ antiporter subunit D [Firmicutes bacterium HGW-Firmicutes-5]|nr:MAG: Na+/H+ antiporter subunit D [Firmicutes bacterium HGW-Firmicutes-5]